MYYDCTTDIVPEKNKTNNILKFHSTSKTNKHLPLKKRNKNDIENNKKKKYIRRRIHASIMYITSFAGRPWACPVNYLAGALCRIFIVATVTSACVSDGHISAWVRWLSFVAYKRSPKWGEPDSVTMQHLRKTSGTGPYCYYSCRKTLERQVVPVWVCGGVVTIKLNAKEKKERASFAVVCNEG